MPQGGRNGRRRGITTCCTRPRPDYEPADREGAGCETRGDRRLGIRAYGLRRGDHGAERANEKFEFSVKWGSDLQSEHERYLTEKYAKKLVIVMNYPKAIKAFYTRVNDDSRTVAAMDVLAPGIGEIIGGSQRGERLDVLDRSMAERGIDREHYAPTLPSPASGGGLGRGICAATARCRTPASASPRLSPGAPSPTSPASPTCAARSPSRAPPATRGIDAHYSRP